MKKMVRRLAGIPVPTILFVMALGLFAIGVYVVSPWFEPWARFATVVDNPLIRYGVGTVYIVIGGTRMAGALKGSLKWMLKAPYALMMSYLFLALLDITLVGLLPLVWIPPALCALVSGICRLALLYGPEPKQ